MEQRMLMVQAIGRLTKIISVIISGPIVVRLLLSISLLRAIAPTMMVRPAPSATTVAIGRQFRAARASVASCTSSRPTCARWTTTVGPLGLRRVRSQNNTRNPPLKPTPYPPEGRGGSYYITLVVGLGENGKCKEKSANCAELINLIINLLQAVKIGSLTKVHIVGHKSTFRGARKYILSDWSSKALSQPLSIILFRLYEVAQKSSRTIRRKFANFFKIVRERIRVCLSSVLLQ